MAKKKRSPALDDFSADLEPFKAAPGAAGWRYVGPDYDKGIRVRGRAGLVRPRDFSQAEAEAFVAECGVKYAGWWASPPGPLSKGRGGDEVPASADAITEEDSENL